MHTGKSIVLLTKRLQVAFACLSSLARFIPPPELLGDAQSEEEAEKLLASVARNVLLSACNSILDRLTKAAR
jgi:hypothetical protein